MTDIKRKELTMTDPTQAREMAKNIKKMKRNTTTKSWAWDDLSVEKEDGREFVYVPQGSTMGDTLIMLDGDYENSGFDCRYVQFMAENGPYIASALDSLAAENERLKRDTENKSLALEIVRGAVDDAIYLEDGLDGSTGEAVIKGIDYALNGVSLSEPPGDEIAGKVLEKIDSERKFEIERLRAENERKDAEIARLKGLVERAYREGWNVGLAGKRFNGKPLKEDYCWYVSESKIELEKEHGNEMVQE